MTKIAFFFASPLLLFFYAGFACGQNADRENPVCNQNFARMMVERQVSESNLVTEGDKRVKILLRAADFLWKPDEAAARKLYGEAFETADARFKEKGFENKRDRQLLIIVPDHRFLVIRAIAAKDAEWAKKLWEKVLADYEERAKTEARDAFDQNREISELLRIAAHFAKENPTLSLQIVRRLNRFELQRDWFFLLFQFAQLNQPLADQIYGELLLNYADAETFRLLYLSAYPFGNARIFGIEKYSMGTSVPAAFRPNPELQKRFLQTFFRRMMALTPENTTASQMVSMPETAVAVTALNEIEPLVAERFPALAEEFQQAKAHVNSLVTNEILDDIKRREKSQNELASLTFEERLKRLEEANSAGKLRDYDIAVLIFNLKTEEEFKKTEFWLLKINDAKTRQEAVNFFFYKRARTAIEEKRLDEARKYADQVPEIEFRAGLYFQIAETELKTSKNRYQTLEILNEVYKIAQKADDSVTKAQVFFGLSSIYAKIDYPTALDSLSQAVKVTNKLDNPDIFVTSLYRQIVTKEGSFYAGYSVSGFDMESTFLLLGEKDLNLTLSHAEAFSDKYFRMLAVVATVKKCAENPKVMNPKKTAPK